MSPADTRSSWLMRGVRVRFWNADAGMVAEEVRYGGEVVDWIIAQSWSN